MITGKVWGSSKTIKANSAVQLHRIEVIKGGFCSKHKHQTKCNGFFVESGKLNVTVWQPSGLVDVTTLLAGDYTDVQAGFYHMFEALADTVAFELYFSEIQVNDIERENCGGRR